MSDPLVQIEKLTKLFLNQKTPALKNICEVFPEGKIIGLVGPDGSGKTTLMRLLAGILKPSQGFITIGGYDTIQEGEKVRSLIGYMPQKFGLYEELSVLQNLHFYAEMKGLLETEREAVFTRLLNFTNLHPFKTRLARDLSGGMKQKLGLACALLKKPKLLLLDEPSVGVDPLSRRELWEMVYELLKESITIVWSTAYLEEAQRCHTTLLLSEGEVLYSGDPKDLTEKVAGRVFKVTHLQKDKRQLLFQLLKEKNVLDVVIQGKDLRVVLKEKLPFAIPEVTVEETSPRFEDGFLDILKEENRKSDLLVDTTPLMNVAVDNAIVAEELTKKFGSFTAAEKITFQVKKGEVFGLLGPNGAGKSTTFKMLCGLLRPTGGKAFVNNLDLQKAPGAARACIGYMAQKFSLYGNLSVQQNLEFFSGIYNLKGADQSAAIATMIEMFNLKPYLMQSAEMLPLGFKQRLSLACANMHHPPVLFLDEPTSGVDPLTRREFWNHINGLVRKGVTILVTTHYMDEAEYCDRIALIYRSKIIAIDTPDALKERVQSPENPNPTLEDTFIKMVEAYDAKGA